MLLLKFCCICYTPDTLVHFLICILQNLELWVDFKKTRVYKWKTTKLDTEVVVGVYIRKKINYEVKSLYEEFSCTNLWTFFVIYFRPTTIFWWIFYIILLLFLSSHIYLRTAAFAWCHAIITLFGVPDNLYIKIGVVWGQNCEHSMSPFCCHMAFHDCVMFFFKLLFWRQLSW
jgi:hypothetical protein